jgi:hypothetical protein
MSRQITLLLVLSITCGCTSLDEQAAEPEAIVETPAATAVRCLCLWQEGEADDHEGRQSRGFAGQVYFFDASDASPIVVRGDLRVFVFDDVGTEEEQARPIEEFDLVSNSLQGFLTTSQIGPAYQIYVPYPRVGRHEANCSLRLRLTQPDGSRVFSEMVQIHLAGTKREDRVQQANAHDLPAAEEIRQKIRLKSETIGTRQDGQVFQASGTQSEDGNASARHADTHQNRLREILDEVKREKQLEQPAVVDVNISARELFEGQPEQQTATSTPDPIPDTTTDELPEVRIQTLSRPLTRKPSSQSDTEPVESDQP